MTFNEEYKKLDNLCKNLLCTDKGVTAYIDEMKKIGVNKLSKNMKDDFHMLVHYRHIRNKIAHDVGISEKNMCSKDDVLWIKNFYSRILKQTDPLAVYLSSKQQNKTRYKPNKTAKKTYNKQYSKRRNYGVAILSFAILILILSVLWVLSSVFILNKHIVLSYFRCSSSLYILYHI